MTIKYVHSNDPKKEKIFDTEQAYKNMMFAILDPDTKLYGKTQAEFDEIYKGIFQRDKEKGIVIEYEIITDKENAK